MEDKIKLHAKYLLTIFHSEETGFTVAKFRLYDGEEKEFTAIGIFYDLQPDVIYTLTGSYVEHSKYGMQFKTEAYEKMKPNDTDSLIRYFSGPLFPGIGKQTARLILDVLGEQAIYKIVEDPDILLTIPKLNDKKRAVLTEGVLADGQENDPVHYLSKLGLGMKMIMKIEAAYGKDTVEKIKENPFLLVEDVDGIGFKTADKIASNLNFEESHPYRIRALILANVKESSMASGDSYLTMDKMVHRLEKKLSKDICVRDYLDELIRDRQLIMEEDRLYHHTQYDAERGIAQFLASFPYIEIPHDEIADIDDEIDKMEREFAIKYEAKQRAAIRCFFEEPFMILTGGPGTGKTTIIKAIIALYKKFYCDETIVCCAPTGRAAKRLSELTETTASTIHSLLHWDLETNTFLINDKDPIQADLLIIDEFSMVDAWLFYNLLKASKTITKILLIGDEDQLPSVGPGAVLRDIIASLQFPIVSLHKIFRQNEGSGVITLAHDVRENICVDIVDNEDVAFLACESTDIRDHIMSIILTAFDRGYADRDIQVLSPMYHGAAGIDTLNSTLQKMMNPPVEYRRELRIGYRIFRENDKVLQLKNQPEDDVYNGDIGKIAEIVYADEDISHMNKIIVDFDGIIVEYGGEQISHITHAYCISIHKSQGSEYPIVIMPVVKEHSYMLQKRLLYTGITRAKQSLILIGDKDVFFRALHAEDRTVRNTTLTKRIVEYLE